MQKGPKKFTEWYPVCDVWAHAWELMVGSIFLLESPPARLDKEQEGPDSLGNSVQFGKLRCKWWFLWEEEEGFLAEEVATEDSAQERAGLIVEPIKFYLCFLAFLISSWTKIKFSSQNRRGSCGQKGVRSQIYDNGRESVGSIQFKMWLTWWEETSREWVRLKKLEKAKMDFPEPQEGNAGLPCSLILAQWDLCYSSNHSTTAEY